MKLDSAYRPEIDGLRAVAVALVIFFHAGFDWMPGGYIGVDVFLVISGYLITRLLLRENQQGDFSFKAFYTRRARRLAPAFLFTIAATFLVALLLLTPADLEKLAREMFHATLGISNFYYGGRVDYFDTASSLRPLLHTWSLAVEEQYYLFAPLFLWITFRQFGFKGVLAVSTLFAVISLLSAELVVRQDPKIAYFWTPFRIWQFVIGGAVLWLPLRWQPAGWMGDIAMTVGLGMIICSALVFSAETSVPGFAALLPCMGVALILATRNSHVVELLLRNPVTRSIGLISYSLYLIHWPIFVFFAHARLAPEMVAGDRLVAIALAVLLAGLMYQFIEKPFRRPAQRNDRTYVFGVLSAAFVSISCAGLTLLYDGLPTRIMHPINAAQTSYTPCRNVSRCEIGKAHSTSKPDLFLVGDSNARQLTSAFDAWGKENGKSVLLLVSPSCNVTGEYRISPVHRPTCAALRATIEKLFKQHPRTPAVMAHLWIGYVGAGEHEKDLSGFLDRNRERPMLLVGQVPYPGTPMHLCGNLNWYLMPEAKCQTHNNRAPAERMNQQLAELLTPGNPHAIFNPVDTICDGEVCRGNVKKQSLYLDTSHLSHQATTFLMENGLASSLQKLFENP